MSHNTFFINPIPDDNGWAVIHHMVAADKPLLNQVRIFVDADKNLLRILVEIDSKSILNFIIKSLLQSYVSINGSVLFCNFIQT